MSSVRTGILRQCDAIPRGGFLSSPLCLEVQSTTEHPLYRLLPELNFAQEPWVSTAYERTYSMCCTSTCGSIRKQDKVDLL